MGQYPEGGAVILLGAYFLLVGLGYLPVPYRVQRNFDDETCEDYRKALLVAGPVAIGFGVAMLLELF